LGRFSTTSLKTLLFFSCKKQKVALEVLTSTSTNSFSDRQMIFSRSRPAHAHARKHTHTAAAGDHLVLPCAFENRA
jgi:hypothetical protein